MVARLGFLITVRERLRSKAIAGAIETGEQILLWARMVVLHFVKIGVAYVGIDPDIIKIVSFFEKWVWIATFIVFFWRIIIGLFRKP
jgi:hypothetical protein